MPYINLEGLREHIEEHRQKCAEMRFRDVDPYIWMDSESDPASQPHDDARPRPLREDKPMSRQLIYYHENKLPPRAERRAATIRNLEAK
jgi:hypothetical protein